MGNSKSVSKVNVYETWFLQAILAKVLNYIKKYFILLWNV